MKRSAWGCSKLRRLAGSLRLAPYAAVGILESLWHVTSREAPRGDIGKLSDKDIALAIGYRGDAGRLLRSLEDTGWVDRSPLHRYVIHDWHEHADDAVRKYLNRNHMTFADLDTECREMSRNVATCPDISRLPLPLPEPMPEPEKGETNSLEAEVVIRSQPEYLRDETFAPFKVAFEHTGAALIESDWIEAHYDWRVLDFEQKAGALVGVKRLMGKDPNFIPKPKNYLKRREWTREQAKRTQTETVLPFWEPPTQ